MGKKSHLRKRMHKLELDDEIALVICVGKNCCSRKHSQALVEASQAYASEAHLPVKVVTVGCLDICKHGPIAATYPTMKFKRDVSPKRARKMIDKLARLDAGLQDDAEELEDGERDEDERDADEHEPRP